MSIPPVQFELKSFSINVIPTATNPPKYSCQLLFADIAGDCEITADTAAAIILFTRSIGANIIAIEPGGFSSHDLPLPIISYISSTTPTSEELSKGKALVENVCIQARRNNVPFGERKSYHV